MFVTIFPEVAQNSQSFTGSVAFSALTLLVGRQEGDSACKKLEWWGAGVVICLERGADLHIAQLMPLPLTVSCSSKIKIGFTFLVPAYLGSPGKSAVKRVCVLQVQGNRNPSIPGLQWHQLDHMQTICTSLQTGNHTNTSSLNFYRPDALPDATVGHPSRRCRQRKNTALYTVCSPSTSKGQFRRGLKTRLFQQAYNL